MGSNKYFVASVAAVTIALWLALAALGGPLNGFDQAMIKALAAERLAYPVLTHAGIWISLAGGAAATVSLTLLAAAFLAWRGQPSRAAVLIAIMLSGRLMVEGLKLWIARPRPAIDYPVAIHSLSFPSGHAANSMIAFVAIALFCAPERRRKAALAFAILASLAVGATRPLLGVHWPSDVLAGWIFGLVWGLAGWRIARGTGCASSA